VSHAFRRHRAIDEGFAMMFPEERLPRTVILANVLKAGGRWLRRHASSRDRQALVHDARRVPSTIAAVIGSLAARRDPPGRAR
jgi:hypothetical protein